MRLWLRGLALGGEHSRATMRRQADVGPTQSCDYAATGQCRSRRVGGWEASLGS